VGRDPLRQSSVGHVAVRSADRTVFDGVRRTVEGRLHGAPVTESRWQPQLTARPHWLNYKFKLVTDWTESILELLLDGTSLNQF
jgi:hypothetical protein